MTQEQKNAYRAAYDYLEQHPAIPYEAIALEQAAKDAGALVRGNPFRGDLLLATYKEVVREAKKNAIK